MVSVSAVSLRVSRLVALVLFAIVAIFACSGTTTTGGALELIIATNLSTPDELDSIHLEVRQEIATGTWGAPIVSRDLRIPTDAVLPATFTIEAGESEHQGALVRVIGRRGGLPIVLSEVETRVPQNRVAALKVVLARACIGKLKADSSGIVASSCSDPAQSCQPDTGQCASRLVDPASLPTYTPGEERQLVVPPQTPVADGGAETSRKEITQFRIDGVDGTIAGTSISLTLPFGTDLTSLTPTIVWKGAAISPASGVAQDFTTPKTYTVTALDGSTKAYTVIVTIAAASGKEITQFVIGGVHGTILGTSITLTVPSGTNVTSLTPTIGITGASISPASGAPQDFSNPVTYTVTASNGSTRDYTVIVNVASASAKDITEFSVAGVAATINATSITLTLPATSNPKSLVPTITITGASVLPASLAAQDFTNAVSYTVTAADGTTKRYTVTVNIAASDAKEITQFGILGVNATITGTNVALTLPSGTNLAGLTPTIAIAGSSVNPASGVAQSFASPVTYTVSAADGSTRAYTVTVSVAAGSARDITAFSILGVSAAVGETSVALTLPAGTNVTSLIPTVGITGVSMTPASGVAKNFTSPVTYTVTAADNTTKAYTVTVTVAQPFTKDITQFSILGAGGVITGTSIALTLPSGTSVTSLVPTITTNGVSLSPASGVAKDFTNPVTYTVTAADNSTKQYTVTVSVAQPFTKDITQFTILGINGTIGLNTVTLQVPYGTSLTNLTPTIQTNGQSVNPASSVAQNFTNPVMYTVTAGDTTTKAYTVTVTVGQPGFKDITQFTILGNNGTIDNVAKTVALTVPYGTSLVSLTPTIQIDGQSVAPLSGVAQNFTNPVTYTVTAGDSTTKAYTVTVTVGPAGFKDITQFTILGVNGTIDNAAKTVALQVPSGTSLVSLTPTIQTNGQSVSPLSGVPQNFSNPVTYTVTAADSTTKQYTVTVTAAPNTAKDITQFTILTVNGSINDAAKTITLTVPYGTSLTSLTPTIQISGLSVSPLSGAAQNFTNPVVYTVTAQDNSTKQYTVTVTVAPNTAKDITQFTILTVNGTIDQAAKTIALTLPAGTSLTSLTPTIVTSAQSTVSPLSGVAQNFTSPVVYIVTAQDTSTKPYTVTVTVAPATKDITLFTINNVSGLITGTNIAVKLYTGTSITALHPQITINGQSVSPLSGAAQNFTNPVTYTVTGQDLTTKAYSVSVSLSSNTGKDITAFALDGVSSTINQQLGTMTNTLGSTQCQATVTALTHNGVSVSPGIGTVVSLENGGSTDFTVTAADGTYRIYTHFGGTFCN
jgi:hypothetical protein